MNEENKLYTSMISIVTSIGAFSVSGISIYCGYDLFRLGVETKVALTATTSSESLEFIRDYTRDRVPVFWYLHIA